MPIDLSAELGPQGRLEVRRWLGEGASGAVYEAWDSERGATVAVKVLRQLGPADLYRFKNEFRTLADVVHPNLVQLYELFSDGERWSFTMELIDGVDFCTFVRGEHRGEEGTLRSPSALGSRAGDSAADPNAAAAGTSAIDGAGLRAPGPDDGTPAFDEVRLRAGLVQLAQGLTALHGAGKLHRDLKPSNVLVGPGGRVVLLDFGLIRDAVPNQTYQSLHEGIVGTPAYMAPEQAAGLELSSASDWYAVGAMLYEALTGRAPFVGGGLRVLIEKQTQDPLPPSAHLSSAVAAHARDLQDLAMELLARDPAKRPSGRAVLRRLGAGASPRGPFASQTTSWPNAPLLVGRGDELRVLREAHELAQRRQVTVLVTGDPGSGKSALVRRFLDGLRESDEPPVVLTGRCYLNESLPYKAVDSLMDALSRYLRGLGRDEARALMPADVQALARLFPVLGRVEAVSASERKVLEVPDSLELRRRAFGALRELFARLAAQQALVLWIDDLQWGDADSAALLAELARPPEPPPLLLIGCVRTGGAASSPLVDGLHRSASAPGAALQLRELAVGPLSLAASETIARHLLAERPPEPPSGEVAADAVKRVRDSVARGLDVGLDAETDSGGGAGDASRAGDTALATLLARASGGNPFFLQALVRYAQAVAEPRPGADGDDARVSFTFPSLDALVAALLARLPPEARALLEVVAVAAHPLTLTAAANASRLDTNLQTALTVLRAGKLVMVREAAGTRWVEPYLTRIAEAVDAVLAPERRRELHSRVAAALLLDSRIDPETLAIHFAAAGEQTRAAQFALQAARRARETLAFDREVELLRLVLDLGEPAEGERRALLVELGEAATNAGRGAEAADAYLAAAPGAKAGEAIELRRRAAEQLLVSGRVDEGLAAIEQVLASIGMRLPRTSRAAFLSLLWRRLLLRLRGTQFRERDSTQVATERLIAIDTCWSVTVGLGLVDTIRGLDFGTRGLLLALRAGEASRVARALALEVGVSGTGGTRRAEATEEIVKQAMRLAKKLGEPRIEGLATVTSGIAAYLRGDFALARERLERGERVLRERCRGVTWELDTATTMLFRALLFLGDWPEIRRRLPAALEGFAARGDLYAETNVRSRMGWVARLMDDQPEAARREAIDAVARWSHASFHLQHYWQLTGLTEITLYEGRPEAAWEVIERTWPQLAATNLLRVQFTRVEANHLRLRAAVAAMAASGLDGEMYRQLQPMVDRHLSRVERERIDWSLPLTQLLRAGLAALEGQRETAAALLERAIAGCETHQLGLYGAAARRRLARLLDGEGEGAGARLAAATAGLTRLGATRPDRWCDVLVPGGWRD
jgi:serine/threonine protein kinase/tetratricopeptide (TPR) repeat protein